MCVICTELIKQKLSIKEAGRNLNELLSGAKSNEEFWHYEELLEAIENDDFDTLSEILDE